MFPVEIGTSQIIERERKYRKGKAERFQKIVMTKWWNWQKSSGSRWKCFSGVSDEFYEASCFKVST